MRSKRDFSQIYQANYREIVGFLAARLPDPALAEDIAGTVFYKAWKSRDSFRAGTSARAWLFTIARHTLIDYWRKHKEMSLSSADEDRLMAREPQPEAAFVEQEQLWALSNALDGLSGTMKSVVVLRFIERLSVKDVAATLNLSESNVRITQFRALAKLREHLQDD